MSESVLIWLFGGVAAWLSAVTAVLIKGYINFNELKTETKAIRLVLISTSDKAFKLLHSPNDHLGLDYYIDEYTRRQGELTPKEWSEVHDICENVLNNPEVTKDQKALVLYATQLATLSMRFSEHKLKAFPMGSKF